MFLKVNGAYRSRSKICAAVSIIEFVKGKILITAMSSNILTSRGHLGTNKRLQNTFLIRKYLFFFCEVIRKYLVDVADMNFVPCWFDAMPKLFLRVRSIWTDGARYYSLMASLRESWWCLPDRSRDGDRVPPETRRQRVKSRGAEQLSNLL